ncbi:hypothetical protein [Phenylobacterium sp.]|uniref:hypothetical protein n=1 Tax=Phenylobacterium sp. TaxID=1871053 RepID=UPI0025E62E17|nr:hypothetical protein [Phenylobacterium sp.]
MAKEPRDNQGGDPRVTDLRAYRKARETAARKAPPRPKPPGQSFLGSNPKAGLILAAVVVILALLYLGPRFL